MRMAFKCTVKTMTRSWNKHWNKEGDRPGFVHRKPSAWKKVKTRDISFEDEQSIIASFEEYKSKMPNSKKDFIQTLAEQYQYDAIV